MERAFNDRRMSQRYELRLSLHYRISQKWSAPRSGSGLTIDISASGISFRCRKPLPVGAHIEMMVDWPARYGELYPIELQITGFVVRSDPGRTAVRMTSRKFRVSAIPAEPVRATA